MKDIFTIENAETLEMKNELNKTIETVIAAAIKVHQELGPGLLESAYEACLAYELLESGLIAERQKALPRRGKRQHVSLVRMRKQSKNKSRDSTAPKRGCRGSIKKSNVWKDLSKTWRSSKLGLALLWRESRTKRPRHTKNFQRN